MKKPDLADTGMAAIVDATGVVVAVARDIEVACAAIGPLSLNLLIQGVSLAGCTLRVVPVNEVVS